MMATGIAGTVSDVDWLSRFWGPASYLRLDRTYTHSIAGTILLSVVTWAILVWASRRTFSAKRDLGGSAQAKATWASRTLLGAIFVAPLCAALLHLGMDACQPDGVELFWPFSTSRLALDWLPNIDPWILAILTASLLLPELLHLVTSEIGAKTKKPRGQLAAIMGLAAVSFYSGARGTLHSNAVAGLEARTYQREWPRRVAAFPEALSVFGWHALVETDSALHVLTIHVGPSAFFDPESGMTLYKPEASAALDAARNAQIARRFLSLARFPKATVQRTDSGGYQVEFRDWRYVAAEAAHDEVAALIQLDANGKVADQELVWARGLERR